MTDDLLLHDVEVDGRRVDVRLRDGAVAEIGPDLPGGGAPIDGGGGALLPGLHDHHLHLVATAALARSIDLSRADGLREALTAADRGLPPGAWIRAVGHHERLGGDLDRHALDAVVPDRPVRVQDRSGARWTLNSVAIVAVDVEAGDHPGIERDTAGRATGRLHRADDWLRARLPVDGPPDLATLGQRLAALGVTGVTDTTAVADADGFRLLTGLPQRVMVTGGPELTEAMAPPELALGPVKLVLDDADYPELDRLVAQVDAAHRADRAVAFHSVTRASLVLALAAIEASTRRRGDRLEHGAVIPLELLHVLRAYQLTVVTQPGFVRERGDAYLTDVDPDDVEDLYRCGSLLAAGIRVAGSTDAPYTDLDPWAAMRTAIDRRTSSGRVVGPGERVDPATALGLFLGAAEDPGGSPRRLAEGEPADLVLLDRPLAAALDEPSADAVVATIVAGEVIHHR